MLAQFYRVYIIADIVNCYNCVYNFCVAANIAAGAETMWKRLLPGVYALDVTLASLANFAGFGSTSDRTGVLTVTCARAGSPPASSNSTSTHL